MSATVGISTQDTWNGKLTWPGIYNEITNVVYTSRYGNGAGGGPATFTCRLVVGPNVKPKGIGPGKILRVWRGAENVWTGVITQPDTGGDGIGVTAEGIGPGTATRWICTEDNNALIVDDQVDAAISRGMPWKRPETAPMYFGVMNPGVTIKDALDEISKQSGMEWTVKANGTLYWSTPRVDVTHVLWAAGQGGARTLDNFGTDFYATYLPVKDAQIDKMEAAPAAQSGASWSAPSNVKHVGEVCAYTNGASVGLKTFFDYNTGQLTPIDMRGYEHIYYYVSSATAVTRTVTLTLYCSTGPRWEIGTSTFALQAGNEWTVHNMSLTNPPPPNGFQIQAVRGFLFETDGAIYLDDINVWGAIRPDAVGNYPTQITADQANVDGRNRYGRHEINVDLTGQGGLNSFIATQAAQVAIQRYGYRPRWTQAFVAAKNSLRNLKGVPVDLASVEAGSRVRVMLADLNEAEINQTGTAVEFVVGEVSYDDDAETLTLTPLDMQRKDLLALLGKLPVGLGQ